MGEIIARNMLSWFYVLVTVHREHMVKRENQQDATNSMFIMKLCISTCFGQHYAHHQENSNFHTVHTAHDAAPQDHSQLQPTHSGRTSYAARHDLVLLMMGIMMPETC